MKLTRLMSDTRFDNTRLVTTPELFDKQGELVMINGQVHEVKKFHDSGIFSERIFGSLTSEDEYSCECGRTTGKVFAGTICQHEDCQTEVKYVESNIDKTGWINIGEGVKVIKYVSYLLLEKVIGRDNLREIISTSNTVDTEGNLVPERFTRRKEEAKSYGLDEDDFEDEITHDPKQRYYKYGISGFEENFYEILDYYHALNNYRHSEVYDMFKMDYTLLGMKEPTKEEILAGNVGNLYEKVPKTNESVFTQYIPVVSTVLRPAMRTKDGLRIDELNKLYVAILTSVQILNDIGNDSEISKILTLEELQSQYFQLSQEIINNIKSKEGLIRNQIAGTRINFSARNIISPISPGFKIDEVLLPYVTFLHLYRFEIINIIRKIKKISFIEAERVWYKATLEKDPEIYKIMTKMVEEEDIGILINRNPTIAYGSILYVKIAGIKEDYDDMTMNISNSLLTLIAGDYDGDGARRCLETRN